MKHAMYSNKVCGLSSFEVYFSGWWNLSMVSIIHSFVTASLSAALNSLMIRLSRSESCVRSSSISVLPLASDRAF